MNATTPPILTVVSRSFPPQVSGSAILLANLLADYPGTANAVVGHNFHVKVDPAFQPPCPVRPLRFPHAFPLLSDRLARYLPVAFVHLLQGAIERALRVLRTDVVMAPYPDATYMVAAFHAARRLRLPFYVHIHDLWEENTSPGSAAARYAATWEPVILRQATRVLCMTEAAQKHYEKKYGIRTDVLPHSICEQDYVNAPTALRPPALPCPTVLFVGAVSSAMNQDALQVLAAASELLPPEYALLFCTSFDTALLQQRGIHSSRLRAQYVSREEVQRLQREAHVLVAPLSHKHCSQHEVQTVFSTKLLEYLIAGRPILVFAPPGSYHAEAAQQRGWAYVVTEDTPEALAAGIMRLITDETLAAAVVCGAHREAEARRARYHASRLHEWVLADTHKDC